MDSFLGAVSQWIESSAMGQSPGGVERAPRDQGGCGLLVPDCHHEDSVGAEAGHFYLDPIVPTDAPLAFVPLASMRHFFASQI